MGVVRHASKKRAALLRIYAKRRRMFLEANPFCRCGRPATEVHHMAGRGALLLEESKWKALCHTCHHWATEHPREAIAVGLSLPRIATGEEAS